MMKGGGNDHLLLEGKYMGVAVTEEKYTMYECDYVVLRMANNPKYNITGDLYEVSAVDMDFIDRYEEINTRKVINVMYGGIMICVQAYVYDVEMCLGNVELNKVTYSRVSNK